MILFLGLLWLLPGSFSLSHTQNLPASSARHILILFHLQQWAREVGWLGSPSFSFKRVSLCQGNALGIFSRLVPLCAALVMQRDGDSLENLAHSIQKGLSGDHTLYILLCAAYFALNFLCNFLKSYNFQILPTQLNSNQFSLNVKTLLLSQQETSNIHWYFPTLTLLKTKVTSLLAYFILRRRELSHFLALCNSNYASCCCCFGGENIRWSLQSYRFEVIVGLYPFLLRASFTAASLKWLRDLKGFFFYFLAFLKWIGKCFKAYHIRHLKMTK